MNENEILIVDSHEEGFILEALQDIAEYGVDTINDNIELYEALSDDARKVLENKLYIQSRNMMAAYLGFVMRYPQDFERYYAIAREMASKLKCNENLGKEN